MHGYIDSFPVPMHLAVGVAAPSKQSKGKGKEKEVSGSGKAESYDVVESWTVQERDDVERKVAMAALLGYSTVVLTMHILPTTNPSTLVFPTPLFPDLDPRTAPAGTEGLVLQLWKTCVMDYSDEAIKSASVKGYYGFTNGTALLLPPSLNLLSVIPTSASAFSHVCLSLSAPSAFSPSLITIDPSLSPRLPFPLKRGLVSTILRAGIRIEIIMRGIVRQDDPVGMGPAGGASMRRRNWIAGAREIVRATGGKGVVLSSGAMKAGEMRGTEDLINLCSLIGLTPSQAKDALTINPQRAISRGLAMRQTYRAVISNPTILTTTSDGDATDLADVTMSPGVKRTAVETELEEEQGPVKKRK